jgi:drug/metabolite transporter (DMT)-like permease
MRQPSETWAGLSPHRTRARPFVPPGFVLLVAVSAMSWAGPLVRLTDAPALAVAAWRLVLAAAPLAGVLLWRRWRHGRWPELRRRDAALAAVAGVLLALHFWSWIESLELTTVASSVVLVSMQPLFVAILSALLLAELPTRRQWAGIGLALAGAVVIGWGDIAVGGTALLGDALAVAGAIFVSGYYIVGRQLRARWDVWTYTGLVYGVAAVVLVAAALLHPGVTLSGYGARDWGVFAALAAGPMLLGHSGINYALGYVPAYVANVAVLGEPIGATLIAWVLPAVREVPGWQTLVGGVLVLLGIAVTVTRRRPASGAAAAETMDVPR